MKCLEKEQIAKWVDGELEKSPAVQEHLETCSACQAQLTSEQEIRNLLKATAFSIEPSERFESGFWQKVNASIKEPWYRKVLAEIDALIPRRAFSPVWAVLLVAMLVGGSGGFLTQLYSFDNQGAGNLSLRRVAGYADYKGLPVSSLAAAYLQWMERKA